MADHDPSEISPQAVAQTESMKIPYATPERGRWTSALIALTLILLALLATLLGALVFRPSHGGRGESSNVVTCSRNLRQIGYAIALYANDNNGRCPPDLVTLLNTRDLTADVFVRWSTNHTLATPPVARAWQTGDLPAGKHLSYAYLGAGKNVNKLPADWVLAYELSAKHHGGRANFLFADGSVEHFPNAQSIIDQLNAGQNPPRGLP